MPFILNSIIFRIFALYNHYEPIPILQLLRGFLSDFAQCIPFILIYSALNNRYSNFIIFILFSLLISANTEHIIVNNGNINYHSIIFIKDKQFLTGSAFSARVLLLFLSSCLLLVLFHFSSKYLYKALSKLPRQIRIRKPVQFVTAIILTSLIPISIFIPVWQQQSVFEQNISSYFFQNNQNSKSYVNSSSYTDINDHKKRNSEYHLLNSYEVKEGTSFLNGLTPEKNVLFILVEGLSQHQVTDNTLNHIKTLGEENFSARHFITSQRQTNRGLYALFCGKYPNLVSRIAKPDIIGLYGTDTLCLPEILSQNGYETVFLQSADLSFMRKDLFTQNIGFHQIIGNPAWFTPRLKTEWGIDDFTLYDSALYKIRELNKQNKKWFMSLLTVSTHHPYNFPGAKSTHYPFKFPGAIELFSYKDALIFADHAVDAFITKLKENRILDDTLVIIMSDEANGTGDIRAGKSETSNFNFLSNNHGPFVAIGKRIPKRTQQDQVFSQVDVPATTLDYLNIENPLPIGGRSIFRQYNSEKKVFFGNVYSDIFGYVEGIHKMVLCGLNLTCAKITFDKDILSGNTFQYTHQSPIDTNELEFIKKIIDINDIFSSNINGGALLLEKNKTYQGKLSYELVSKFKITGDGGKPVEIGFKIDNTLSTRSEELTLEIKIESYKSRNEYESKIKVDPGELKSFVKDILLNENEEYSLDINVEAENTEKWNANLIQIHY